MFNVFKKILIENNKMLGSKFKRKKKQTTKKSLLYALKGNFTTEVLHQTRREKSLKCIPKYKLFFFCIAAAVKLNIILRTHRTHTLSTISFYMIFTTDIISTLL